MVLALRQKKLTQISPVSILRNICEILISGSARTFEAYFLNRCIDSMPSSLNVIFCNRNRNIFGAIVAQSENPKTENHEKF